MLVTINLQAMAVPGTNLGRGRGGGLAPVVCGYGEEYSNNRTPLAQGKRLKGSAGIRQELLIRV